MIHFFDFEVFKHDWLVCFYTAGEGWTTIHNDRDALTKVWEVSAGDVWIGFNSRHYDQYIFKAILAGYDPKAMNEWIITEDRNGWEFADDLMKYPLNNYDVRHAIDRGLKTFEGFMGSSIVETSVPFDIDRELTAAEVEEVTEYCKYDVTQTMQIFSTRQDAFKAHIGLVNWAKMPLSKVSKTGTRLSADILKAQAVRPKLLWEEFDIRLPDTLELSKYRHVADWYLDPANHRYKGKDGKKHQLVTDVAGVPHAFGYGGLHGARERYSGEGYYLNMDVASLYPSLMIEYGLMSRAVPDPAKFREIRDQRLEYKRAKDPRSDALKLVLNSTYGAMKDKHNPLYDPRQANLVCVYGQLLLLDLIEKLETVPGLEVIQSNTDGVLVKMRHASDYDLIDDVCAQWEERTRLELEFDEFAKVAQSNVNNYVIVAHDGSYKSKGAWVKELSETDYDLPVVNRTIAERIVNGTPVDVTVSNTHALRDFQLICSAGSKYKGLWHGDTLLQEKTVRAFASTKRSDPGLSKEHKSGSIQKVASSPEHCFMVNGNVIGESVTGYPLDKAWYVSMAKERLKSFGVES